MNNQNDAKKERIIHDEKNYTTRNNNNRLISAINKKKL